jgi:predicted hotdog family 3-hydroxylacyl-ACP dehydratase
MILQGEGIYQLIPQRPPITMVDKLWDADAESATTGLTIKADNIFVSEGMFREPGLIEHIAQSAAAFAGYEAYSKGLPPRIGYIGEIKKCHIYFFPQVGQQLKTQIRLTGKAGEVSLIEALTECEGEKAVECQMKIFLKSE